MARKCENIDWERRTNNNKRTTYTHKHDYTWHLTKGMKSVKKEKKKIPCEKNCFIFIFSKKENFLATRFSFLLMWKKNINMVFSPIDLNEQNIWWSTWFFLKAFGENHLMTTRCFSS
jgi:hypothetical protein